MYKRKTKDVYNLYEWLGKGRGKEKVIFTSDNEEECRAESARIRGLLEEHNANVPMRELLFRYYWIQKDRVKIKADE